MVRGTTPSPRWPATTCGRSAGCSRTARITCWLVARRGGCRARRRRGTAPRREIVDTLALLDSHLLVGASPAVGTRDMLRDLGLPVDDGEPSFEHAAAVLDEAFGGAPD
ncbi:hypothetical protein NJ76_31530 [Rhodococcus sp. IITR03]|nr:hypothetical protein NJ76_31530 [Rhodococcus sp. IITR03]